MNEPNEPITQRLQIGQGHISGNASIFLAVLAMCAVHLVGRRLAPRYGVIATLIVGLAFAYASGLIHLDEIRMQPSALVFTMPTFSW